MSIDDKHDKFPVELLQLINNWQSGLPKADLQDIGEQISALTIDLDPYYRTENCCCYRKIDLDKKSVWRYAEQLHLVDHYGSWTLSLDIAKSFGGGVPPKGYQGVILCVQPEHFKVVLNLTRLYMDTDFLNACHRYRSEIKKFGSGIGAFGNRELEVIMYIEEVPISSVYALGGFSHNLDELVKLVIGHDPSVSELQFYSNILKKSGKQAGPNWITDAAKDRSVNVWLKAYEKIISKH